MDAWIKGIRRLTVIYYNYVPPEAAGRTPGGRRDHGDHDPHRGLRRGAVPGAETSISSGCPAASRMRGIFSPSSPIRPSGPSWTRAAGFRNTSRTMCWPFSGNSTHRHRPAINDAFGIDLAPLDPADFLAFVAGGQASILHLGEFIHSRLLPLLEVRMNGLRSRYDESSARGAPPDGEPREKDARTRLGGDCRPLPETGAEPLPPQSERLS